MNNKVIGYIYLDEDDIRDIHTAQLAQFGGADGIRNAEALSGAIANKTITKEDLADLFRDLVIEFNSRFK